MTLTHEQRERIERDLPLVLDLSMLPAPGDNTNTAKERSMNPTAHAGGRHVCTVPGHRCAPSVRAPWIRSAAGIHTRHRGRRPWMTGPFRRLPTGERWLWMALLIGCALLVATQVAKLVAR